MKTKLNHPAHFNLNARALAALVIRCGGRLQISREELNNIAELEVDVDPRSGEVTLAARNKYVEKRREHRGDLGFPDRRRAAMRRTAGWW